MTLSTQFITIFTMIAGGVYLGAALDTLRRFDHNWKHRKVFSYLLEVSFWLLQTLLLFYLLFLSNQGELRFYIFLAVLCGFSAYMSLFKTMYNKALNKFIKAIVSIYHFFYHLVNTLIIRPIMWIFHLLLAIFLWILGMLLWTVKLLLRVLFYPIQLLYKLIRRILPESVKKYLHKIEGFYSKIKNTLFKWWKKIRNKG